MFLIDCVERQLVLICLE